MPQSAILSEAEFTLNGGFGELERIAGRVAQFCRAHALDTQLEYDINLVLEELFINAVKYGGCLDKPDAVHIRLALSNGSIRVEFSDRGAPFDPSVAPVPNIDAPLEERRPGGLGIHLVRQLMGDLVYQRSGEWNRIAMNRKIEGHS